MSWQTPPTVFPGSEHLRPLYNPAFSLFPVWCEDETTHTHAHQSPCTLQYNKLENRLWKWNGFVMIQQKRKYRLYTLKCISLSGLDIFVDAAVLFFNLKAEVMQLSANVLLNDLRQQRPSSLVKNVSWCILSVITITYERTPGALVYTTHGWHHKDAVMFENGVGTGDTPVSG